MTKRRLDVGIESVNEVYNGPGGILWEMLMGEEIHLWRNSAALAGRARPTCWPRRLESMPTATSLTSAARWVAQPAI
jgi:hypothetical protein